MESQYIKSRLELMLGSRGEVKTVGASYIKVGLDIEFQMTDWSDEFREKFFILLGNTWNYDIDEHGDLHLTEKQGCRCHGV